MIHIDRESLVTAIVENAEEIADILLSAHEEPVEQSRRLGDLGKPPKQNVGPVRVPPHLRK